MHIRVQLNILQLLIAAAVLLLLSCASIIKPRFSKPHAIENGEVIFHYYAPNANTVTLAGSFNSWGGLTSGGEYDPTIDPFNDSGTNGDAHADDGIWTLKKELPRGRHQYKIVVDYHTWVKDPSNPDTAETGREQNSLIIVQ